MSEKVPLFRSAEEPFVLDNYEVQGMADIMQLATDPSAYMARKADELTMAKDEPGAEEIACELLSDIETDLNILRENNSVIRNPLLDPIMSQGNSSEVGLKFVYKLCKEVGLSKSTMLAAIAMQSADKALTQLNNKSHEKYLREVYNENDAE